MLAAATAWDGLAAQMSATATSGAAVVAALAAGWNGPSSTTMMAAAQRTLAWIHLSAAEAEQTAAQQRAAAAAYETAFAATVPPPAIATNRSLQASLIATNFLGQNSAAIAALEAQYLQMWAQDAGAMLNYAASATSASQLAPFSDPPQTAADPAATAAATDPSPGLSLLSGLTGPFSPLSLLNPVLGGYLFSTEMYGLPSVSANVAELAQKVAALPSTTAGAELVDDAARPAVRPVAVSTAASVGRAGIVGRLSVPPSWIATAPAVSPAAEVARPAAVTQIAGHGILAGELALAGAAGGALAANGATTRVVASHSGNRARTAAGSTIFVIQAADWPEERQA